MKLSSLQEFIIKGNFNRFWKYCSRIHLSSIREKGYKDKEERINFKILKTMEQLLIYLGWAENTEKCVHYNS